MNSKDSTGVERADVQPALQTLSGAEAARAGEDSPAETAGAETAGRSSQGGSPDLPDDLSDVVLKGRDLRGAQLSGKDLSGRDLSGADLSGAKLMGANLRGAKLFGAKLCKAELLQANLSDADLSKCDAASAGFGNVDLRGALLFGANLKAATLTQSCLAGADLRAADLSNARLRETDLSGADLSRANLQGADLSQARVDRTRFFDCDLRHSRLRGIRGHAAADWVGADVRDADFAGAYMARREIADQNYLHEFRNQNRISGIVYWIWWATSDCGRSISRWTGWIVFIVLAFAGLFETVRVDWGDHPTWLSSIYYSVVTLTTLGYGDVIPASVGAQIIAMIEVFLGYVMLGGLLSIFSNKMARRAD